LINSKNLWEYTPLMKATQRGSLPCLLLLIEKRADITCTDDHGRTAIMHAAMVGSMAAITTLLFHGARVDFLAHNETCILELTEYAGHHHITDFLLKNFPKKINGIPLCTIAAKKNQSELLEKLVQHGHSIEEVERNGSTPLLFAVRRGHVTCVKKLLDLGALITKRNNHRESPFSIACSHSCRSLYKSASRKICELLSKKMASKIHEFSTYDIEEAHMFMVKSGFLKAAVMLEKCFSQSSPGNPPILNGNQK